MIESLRVHVKKRTKLFDPRESPHPNFPEHMLKDERRTLRIETGKKEQRGEEGWDDQTDNWRIGGLEKRNQEGIQWTRRTVFTRRKRERYLAAPSIGQKTIKRIPVDEIFIAGHISCNMTEWRGVGTVQLIMVRSNNNKEIKFVFEIPHEVPRLVLLCSEEVNGFTILNTKTQEKFGRREGVGEVTLLVVTITVHDDLNSDYGFKKASTSLRDERDSMFFAGPCTGGSSWSRLNRSKGPETREIIERKVQIFKQLWGRFETLFLTFYPLKVGIYMELPRGCLYWSNAEVKMMIEGTDSTINDFDGCCYGLRQKFGNLNMYIKKPWRIVSWNAHVGKRLPLRCDGRHDHAPCAGRETIHTQLCTSKMVSIVLEEVHRRIMCAEQNADSMHANGSSGNGNKKLPMSAACAVSASRIKNKPSPSKQFNFINLFRFTITIKNKSNIRSRYQWAHPLIPKRSKINPNRGFRGVFRRAQVLSRSHGGEWFC